MKLLHTHTHTHALLSFLLDFCRVQTVAVPFTIKQKLLIVEVMGQSLVTLQMCFHTDSVVKKVHLRQAASNYPFTTG